MNIEDLIEPLLERTLSRKISWDSSDDEEFSTKLGDFIVEISTSNGIYWLNLRSINGRLIENISHVPNPFVETKSKIDKIQELYEAARRNSLQVDESLEKVFKVLKSL